MSGKKIKKRLCEFCGKYFYRLLYGKGKNKYCSRKCYDKDRMIEGSREPYTYDFNIHLKIQIAKRDNYICQLCGKKTKNIISNKINI